MPEPIEPTADFRDLDEFLDQTSAGQFLQGEAVTDVPGVLDASPEFTPAGEETELPTALELVTRIGMIATTRKNYEKENSFGFNQKYDDSSEIDISLLLMPKETEDGLLRGIVESLDMSGDHSEKTVYFVYADGRVIKASLVTAIDMSGQKQERRWLEPDEVKEFYSSLLEHM